jgi:Flp pilus assembly protein TadB
VDPGAAAGDRVIRAIPAILAGAATAGVAAAVCIAATACPRLPAPVVVASPRPHVRRPPVVPTVSGAVALGCLVAPGPLPLLAPVAGLVAWCLPSFLRGRATRRRLAAADAELPQLLDLLAAASSAGLSASLSLRRAVAALDGPLAEELRSVVQAVDLGGRWRDELAAVAERLGLPDLRRTVAALSRTDTLGSSLATSMHELAARVRAARRAAVTERARTAPVKMLFPLVFLVLPAFLLLTVVPVLLTTLQSIR